MAAILFNHTDAFPVDICPLTGIPTKGRALIFNHGFTPELSYAFKPIGVAVFSIGQLTELTRNKDRYSKSPRTDLAGICRNAAERGQPPVTITLEMFTKPQNNGLESFEEKRMHFLRLLYDTGGKEHKSRTINTIEDFPMAFASGAEEFYRIIESLLDEKAIKYKEDYVCQGDWEGDILGLYQGVLLTPEGKRIIVTGKSSSEHNTMSTNTFNIGDKANVNVIQGDNATQTSIVGKKANVNVATGSNNTQTNQPASLAELTEQLKLALAPSSFDTYREEIEHEFERIELQLKKAEPKKSILERSFDYLKDMAVKAAGPAAAHAVIELTKHAPELIAASGLGS